jgi:hypothetical protein
MKNKTLDKISQAEKILEQEREDLFRIVTTAGIDDFGSQRDFLAIIEEDTKYKIKALGLPKRLLKYYLGKVCDIYGPYSEDQPDKKKKYYDNDFYI